MKKNRRENAFPVVVCVKQVPAGTQAKIDPVTKTLIRSAGASILNPYDTFATEAALQIRDSVNADGMNGSVTALSMGVPSVKETLSDLYARGVDEGVLMTDKAFAGADTFDTAYTLSLGIREIEKKTGLVSLIVCGHMATDGDTAQIGPELAQTLRLPHVSNVTGVTEVNAKEGTITVNCITADGRQTFLVRLPALITVSKDINVLRMPSIAGIRKAEHFTVRMLSAKDLGVDLNRVGKNGAPTQVVRTFTPEIKDAAVRLNGSVKESAKKVRDIIGGLV